MAVALLARAAAGALAWNVVSGAVTSASQASGSAAPSPVAAQQAAQSQAAALADLQTRWDSPDLDLKSITSKEFQAALLAKLNADDTDKPMKLDFREALWIAGATGINPGDTGALTEWRNEFRSDVKHLQEAAQQHEADRQAALAASGVETDDPKQPGQPAAADAHARDHDFAGIDPDTADSVHSAAVADSGKPPDNTSGPLMSVGVAAGLAGLFILALYYGSHHERGGLSVDAGPAWWRAGGR